MARPRKQTVDYFPHDTDASEGKTLTIIQNKFGNDGYAFWFKLLQILGKSRGHYYNFESPADWEFLLAKTHISDPEIAENILETLATLGAIDKELYEKKVIWSQNFVDRVADVYEKRTGDSLPQKPDFRVIDENKVVSVEITPVSDSRNTQTKLKETKLHKTKFIPYPEFPNIKMTIEEYGKLEKAFGGPGARDRIEALSLYKRSKGKQYKDDYATILTWDRREKKEQTHKRISDDPNKYKTQKYGDLVQR